MHGRLSAILRKLEVAHEPGLTQTQLFLRVRLIFFGDARHVLTDFSIPRMKTCYQYLRSGAHGKLGTLLPCKCSSSHRSETARHNDSSYSWIADSFNINTWMIVSSMIINGLSWWQGSGFIFLNLVPESFVSNGSNISSLDMRMAWLWLRCTYFSTECSPGRDSPYHLSGCCEVFFWYLGIPMDNPESRRDGLVRDPLLDLLRTS
jgi:Permease for cytosine/purines, uracil, thiamine, allantoin